MKWYNIEFTICRQLLDTIYYILYRNSAIGHSCSRVSSWRTVATNPIHLHSPSSSSSAHPGFHPLLQPLPWFGLCRIVNILSLCLWNEWSVCFEWWGVVPTECSRGGEGRVNVFRPIARPPTVSPPTPIQVFVWETEPGIWIPGFKFAPATHALSSVLPMSFPPWVSTFLSTKWESWTKGCRLSLFTLTL